MPPDPLLTLFRSKIANDFIRGVVLWALLVCVYALYTPALDAPWQFDDAPNLQGLSKVKDTGSALTFVTSGISSSLGRPLALATFLPNAPAWPSDPASFRHVNILLHLINGALLAWIALRIGRLCSLSEDQAIWPALTLTAIWLLHPFLASTSLMVVQRMTSLAATLTLAGLLAFVHGRSLLTEWPRAAYTWMSLALVLGAGLGTLAKENAALLPFFAAVLCATVLRHLPTGNQRMWHIWRLLFFTGPALLLLTYVSMRWSSILQGYAARPFSFEERLLSEPVILWTYIRQILIPDISAMGPFQDDATIQTGFNALSISAIFGLLVLTLSAVVLRKRYPWLAFAVLWFLAGHVLESTVFNLELYFEHRNYLPSLGPLAALVALAWSGKKSWPRVATATAALIAAFLLWQVTTLWGEPLLAAERWADKHPSSNRATQHLSQRYVLIGDHQKALSVIEQGSRANPAASDLAIQTIQLSCGLVDEYRIRDLMEKLIDRANTLIGNLATAKATNSIRLLIADGNCPGLDEDRLIRLINALLQSPTIHNYGLIRHHLHHQMGEIYTNQGNLDGAVRNLEAAFEAQPNPETAQLLAVTFASAGLYSEAIKSLDYAMTKAPLIGLKRKSWENSIIPLKKLLITKSQSSEGETPAHE